MPAWEVFASQAPAMAAFGVARLHGRAAYLGTLRADGGPRVHPVTPILSPAQLFVFMEPTSPKGKDLQRDSRYTLHCGVEDTSGGAGEFYVRGTARLVTDPAERQRAIAAAPYNPADRYILFELYVDFAFQNTYQDGKPTVTRWSATG